MLNLNALRSIRIHRNAFQLRRSLLANATRSRPNPPTSSSSQPESLPTVLLSSPSPTAIAEQELDVEIMSSQDINIEITQRAAEQLCQISVRENNPDAALRIAVESGGCHGYQYKMDLAFQSGPDDYRLSHPTLRPSNILVDAVSMSLLNGSSIDFATELIGSSFRILHNPHAKGSGCGCGVSWELQDVK